MEIRDFRTIAKVALKNNEGALVLLGLNLPLKRAKADAEVQIAATLNNTLASPVIGSVLA